MLSVLKKDGTVIVNHADGRVLPPSTSRGATRTSELRCKSVFMQ